MMPYKGFRLWNQTGVQIPGFFVKYVVILNKSHNFVLDFSFSNEKLIIIFKVVINNK